MKSESERQYFLETVRNVLVVQAYADDFEKLTLKEKMLAWHLYRSSVAGWDIYYDQGHKHGLKVRNILEQIIENGDGIDEYLYDRILEYTKMFWINTGQYDFLTSRKFVPEFTFLEFSGAASIAQANGADFGFEEDIDVVLRALRRTIFDKEFESIKTNKNPEEGIDMLEGSAVNFYDGVKLSDLENFVEVNPLNSKIVVEDGEIKELVWRAGNDVVSPGLYAEELERAARELEKAVEYAPEGQANVLRLLAKYFRTGDLNDFREYNIAWVQDSSFIDFISGFIETYDDPRGQKGAYESVVEMIDVENSKLMKKFADNALYFESKAPWKDEYKRTKINPPLANVMTILIETGNGGPISWGGINLPNEQYVRETYGSKSILLGNVVKARNEAAATLSLEEFASSEEEIELSKKYGGLIADLFVAMHEVVGHASGKKSESLEGDPSEYLDEYYSTLEEARSDLVALWNFFDPKLVEMDLAPSIEVGKVAYDRYIRAALTQHRTVPEGDQFEEDHDRGTQMIVEYIRKNTSSIEIIKIDGKTYYKVTDYDEMRRGVGEILAKLMEIKATGDYEGAKAIIEEYGLKFDISLRDEVLERSKAIGLTDYTAIVFPSLTPVYGGDGEIKDIEISYPMDLKKQMFDFKHFFDEDSDEVVVK
ncbi:peptidase M49 [Candidatus Marinimicrobia bacterium MT.SAG.3]|nr:peptidase M49 [Candidatus Neomarinimicrobiota bacterium]TFB09832.1 peptidase M49 [Candidatus Marinimicrobia bacterium MT.SAG.3]